MANKRITDVDIITSLNGDESFFINQNNAIKQINKKDVVFGITNGGTGATNLEDAKKNLGISNITPKNIGAQPQHITAMATILANGWSSNSQTVTVDGVTSTNTVIVGAHPSCQKIYAENGVFCVGQKDNKLIFSCELVPESDIQANVIIMN